jgi:hypothetical protein
MKQIILIIHLLSFSLFAFAGDTSSQEFEAVPEPPDLPDPVVTGETMEPQVTIIRKDDAVIEEYRINGFLYMVKITPAIGPSYYLMDKTGNGELDTRRNSLEDTNVPQWVLFTW